MRDEGFDQIAARVLDGLGAAEMGGIFLNEGRIEVVLADQKAELVAEAAGATVRAIPEPFESVVRAVRVARGGWRLAGSGSPS